MRMWTRRRTRTIGTACGIHAVTGPETSPPRKRRRQSNVPARAVPIPHGMSAVTWRGWRCAMAIATSRGSTAEIESRKTSRQLRLKMMRRRRTKTRRTTRRGLPRSALPVRSARGPFGLPCWSQPRWRQQIYAWCAWNADGPVDLRGATLEGPLSLPAGARSWRRAALACDVQNCASAQDSAGRR